MELEWTWKTVLIVAVGIVVLRFAGRKSISQMTLAQTVIMIAIGSLLIQPVSGRNIWLSFQVAGMLVLTLIVIEYLVLKFDWIERLVTGKPIPIIIDGRIQEKHLKKTRLTLDQLEMQLRQKNVVHLEHVKHAIHEPSGQVSFVLHEPEATATKRDIQELTKQIERIAQALEQLGASPRSESGDSPGQSNKPELFLEVVDGHHKEDPPKHLQ